MFLLEKVSNKYPRVTEKRGTGNKRNATDEVSDSIKKEKLRWRWKNKNTRKAKAT